MKKQNKMTVLIVASIFSLAGCGGGGGANTGSNTGSNTGTGTGTTADTVAPVVTISNTGSNTGTGTGTTADTVAPVVTINGESEVSVEQFFLYTEVGAKAIDDVDGELEVYTSGEVDISTPNVYIITYSVTDSSGNTGKAERYVTVLPAAEDPNATKIDTLSLYSQGVDDLYVGEGVARIEHLIAVSNQINNASHVGLEIVPVAITKYAMDDSASSYTVLDDITADQNVAQMRQAAKADEVFIYRPIVVSDGVCGLGWLNNDLNPASAFAHISIDCPTDVTAHEFGHNLGLAHDHEDEKKSGFTGRTGYAYGHFVLGGFATMMAYNYELKFITVYSSPALDCGTEPCGIEAGEVGESDSVKAIIEIKKTVSEFY